MLTEYLRIQKWLVIINGSNHGSTDCPSQPVQAEPFVEKTEADSGQNQNKAVLLIDSFLVILLRLTSK